jgi:hypothetical protein
MVDLKAAGDGEAANALSDVTFPLYENLLYPDHPDVRTAKEGRHLDFDFDPPPI